jgi:hypothetical protein
METQSNTIEGANSEPPKMKLRLNTQTIQSAEKEAHNPTEAYPTAVYCYTHTCGTKCW